MGFIISDSYVEQDLGRRGARRNKLYLIRLDVVIYESVRTE